MEFKGFQHTKNSENLEIFEKSKTLAEYRPYSGNFFTFFKMSSIFAIFSCVEIHWTPNRNCSKFVRNLDFGSKTILQSFRMTKIDHIPYPDHNFWMKIDCCGIWFLTLMDFHVFYTFCTVFLYWPLQSSLWGPFRWKKLFFQLFPKWPVWVEKMCSGVLEGPSTCVLPISKLIMTIFHD